MSGTEKTEKGALMQTCGLRAASRGGGFLPGTGPILARAAPDQEGQPPFPNPSPPPCAGGSRSASFALIRVSLRPSRRG